MIFIGHRGLMAVARENTLASFQAALDAGMDIIETDVRYYQDQLVVAHDPITSDTSLDSVLSLQAVFDFIDARVRIYLDIKETAVILPLIEFLQDNFRQNWQPSDILIASFHHYHCLTFWGLMPQITRGIIFNGTPIGYSQIAKAAHAQFIVLCRESLGPEMLADCARAHLPVYVYTINDAAAFQDAVNRGVAAVITDVTPGILTSAREK